jgi:hypothetical protein
VIYGKHPNKPNWQASQRALPPAAAVFFAAKSGKIFPFWLHYKMATIIVAGI